MKQFFNKVIKRILSLLKSVFDNKKFKKTIFFLDVLFFIFIFTVGINGVSESLFLLLSSHLSSGFFNTILLKLANPCFGLFVGIVATAILQSSSTTSAIIIAVVSPGILPFRTAIPIILGTNFGTTITNTLVALLQRKKSKAAYERSLAASTLHDFYNIITLLITFPLEIKYHFVEKASFYLYEFIGSNANSMTRQFNNPLVILINSINQWISSAIGDNPLLYFIVSLSIAVLSISSLVNLLKKRFLPQIEQSLSQKLFATKFRSWLSGVTSTMLIQSSSITTSLVIPLASSEKLTLEQIYPYTVGANIGTGLTAFVAAASLNPIAIIAAIASLLFDTFSTFIVFLNPLISNLPLYLAKQFGFYGAKYKRLPYLYIAVAFIVLPFLAIQL